jgi:hypothetical protein
MDIEHMVKVNNAEGITMIDTKSAMIGRLVNEHTKPLDKIEI